MYLIFRHLRDHHCTREGGSFVCRYGSNGVCASLPLDGVNNRDYESHVNRYHVNQVTRNHEQWTVFSAAQNLPAVLNDPNRSKQTTFFTRTWGDSFVDRTSGASNRLPDITWNHFQTYLIKIGKRYKRHARFDKQQQTPQHNGTELTGNYGLQDIPQIFMKPHLELSNPATFASVFTGVGDGATQSGRLLQEKLSHYLDIVEVQIARQVAQKSSAFFHAMTSQDTIMAQMGEASANVRQLRSKLHYIDETQVKKFIIFI